MHGTQFRVAHTREIGIRIVRDHARSFAYNCLRYIAIIRDSAALPLSPLIPWRNTLKGTEFFDIRPLTTRFAELQLFTRTDNRCTIERIESIDLAIVS